MKEQQAAGRRPAGPAAADRPALSARGFPARRAARRAPDEPGAAADAGFRPALRAIGAARSSGRLAIAARAVLGIDGAGGSGGASRAEPRASRAVPRRRDRDARRRLHLQRHPRSQARRRRRAHQGSPAALRPRRPSARPQRFLVAQALVGLAVLVSFNAFSIALGLASLAIVAVYPLMKRVTSWPQAVLGLAFSWGALMGWAATLRRARAAGAAALRLGVLLDDRLRHDLRAAGRARRRHRRHQVDGAAVRRPCAARRRPVLSPDRAARPGRAARWSARAYVAELGWAGFCAHLLWQLAQVEGASPATALKLFRSNRDAGLILFSGIALEGWLRSAGF